MRVLVLAGALALSACVTMPQAPSMVAVEQAQVRYDKLKGWADLLAPYLPTAYADRLRNAETIAERALLAARAAATLAEQRAALQRAEEAMAVLKPAP